MSSRTASPRRRTGCTSSETPTWVWPVPGGAVVRVRVGPGASRAGVIGLHGGALRVRVTAPPANGAANRDLCRLLAAALGVRPSAVSIESGRTGRDKLVRVQGVAADVVRACLAGLSVDTSLRHD